MCNLVGCLSCFGPVFVCFCTRLFLGFYLISGLPSTFGFECFQVSCCDSVLLWGVVILGTWVFVSAVGLV